MRNYKLFQLLERMEKLEYDLDEQNRDDLVVVIGQARDEIKEALSREGVFPEYDGTAS